MGNEPNVEISIDGQMINKRKGIAKAEDFPDQPREQDIRILREVWDLGWEEGYKAARSSRDRLREALKKLRDCDWTISLPDRMHAVREIAREALSADEEAGK